MPILPPYTISYKPIASTGKTVMIVNFMSKERMNELLAPISNMYEGSLKQNREGHNFPSFYVPREHVLYKHIESAANCAYVIGVYNPLALQHELLHARFYADSAYKEHIINEWNNLDEDVRDDITKFLKRLGYRDSVIIDEYQAYRYTEKSNFFGVQFD
jgi:hypothetical protein